MPKGDDTKVLIEVRNKRAWGYQGFQEESALDMIRGGMMRWRKKNPTRSLFRYLNRTSSKWRGDMERVGSI